MSLLEFAQIYVDLVKAEELIPEEEWKAKEEINSLRTKYHDILMDQKLGNKFPSLIQGNPLTVFFQTREGMRYCSWTRTK